MADNKVKNIPEAKLYECPRCHIKFNKKEINLHNIKCRKINNAIEKDTNNSENSKKDEYRNFIEKITKTNIDDKNIKSLFKNFCIIFGNKIEILENNIIELNNKIRKLNENNALYFKKINDSLDNINKQYLNKKEINKNKQNDIKLHTFHSKPILNKNETDLNIFEPKNVKNTKKVTTPFILEVKEEIIKQINNSNLNQKKTNKKQFMSEKKIQQINKETKAQFNDNVIDNKKYKEIIKREKKKENKYKVKKLKKRDNNYIDISNKFNTINILTEENIINNTSNNNNAQINMRRSLSFGDLNNLIKSNNKANNNENDFKNDIYENKDDNNDEEDILIDTLDLIMEKISNLEESLINLGLNDCDLKEKIFPLKSKDFEYSNSESFHSEPSEKND